MIMHEIYEHFSALFGVQRHVILGRKLIDVVNSRVQQFDRSLARFPTQSCRPQNLSLDAKCVKIHLS